MLHILLAAYNEESALGQVLEGVARTLADGDFRVWVVDDGSRDGTAGVAKTWSSRVPMTLMTHDRNRGLGAALQTGLAHILPVLKPNDILVTLDADNTHPPQVIPHLTRPLEEGRADVAIASRFVPGGKMVGVPFLRRLASYGAKAVFRWFHPISSVRDYTCGYRAYRGDILRRAQTHWGRLVTEEGFAAAAEWLARVAFLSPRIVEVPLVLRYDRKPGRSKMPVFKTVRRTLVLLKRLREMRKG